MAEENKTVMEADSEVEPSQYRYNDINNPPKDPEPYQFDLLEKLGVAGTKEDRDAYRDTIRGSIDTGKDLYVSGPERFLRGSIARQGKKSIIGMAAKNTFEFPVFVSKSIPLDYATAINSLLEQIYSSYLQMAVTLNPIIDSKTVKVGGPFANFKTNITKYIEYTDMFYAHDAAHAIYTVDDVVMEFNMISITDEEATIINEAVEYQPLSEFSHYFQEASSKPKKPNKFYQSEETRKNDYEGTGDNAKLDTVTTTTTPSEAEKVLLDKKIEAQDKQLEQLDKESASLARDMALKQKQIDELQQRIKHNNAMNPLEKQKIKEDIQKIKQDKENAKKQFEKIDEEVQALQRQREDETIYDKEYVRRHGIERLSHIEEIINKRRKLIYDTQKSGLEVAKMLDDLDRDDARWKMERERHAKDMMTRGPQYMDETKLQKLNTMKPLMMTVQLKVIDKNGGISAPIEYVVGVKTHCRLVDPDILPDVVKYPLKKMDRLTRKAKWRAGEIKFFDYLFNIKEKKQTAVDAKDPKRKWYRRLYELAHKKGDANVAARISGNNTSGLIPNATIVMSQTDVDLIKNVVDINLLKSSSARSLCNELFLMSLIIVDLDAESIKILLPDINNDFEIHSLASVKKQLATLDTASDKTRDMFKLLGR